MVARGNRPGNPGQPYPQIFLWRKNILEHYSGAFGAFLPLWGLPKWLPGVAREFFYAPDRMPYKLRKARGKEAYYVVNTETGKKHSKSPLPKETAKAQMRALYANEPKSGGARLLSRRLPTGETLYATEDDMGIVLQHKDRNDALRYLNRLAALAKDRREQNEYLLEKYNIQEHHTQEDADRMMREKAVQRGRQLTEGIYRGVPGGEEFDTGEDVEVRAPHGAPDELAAARGLLSLHGRGYFDELFM